MEMLGIMRKAKNMMFHPQYAQCFTAKASLPHTNDYNFQYQNTSTMQILQIKEQQIPPTVPDVLFD
jgi:hypothetical protein